MDEVIGYKKLRAELCNVIAKINQMDSITVDHRNEILAVFDKLTEEIVIFRYNMFKYIPNEMLHSSTPSRSPVFLTSPFQLN